MADRVYLGGWPSEDQHDAWAVEVAFRRHIRRLGGAVGERLAAEQRFLAPLLEPRPNTDLHFEARTGKDAFVRVLGVDYSVPPAFVRRRVAVRISPTTVRISCEGSEVSATRWPSRDVDRLVHHAEVIVLKGRELPAAANGRRC